MTTRQLTSIERLSLFEFVEFNLGQRLAWRNDASVRTDSRTNRGDQTTETGQNETRILRLGSAQ